MRIETNQKRHSPIYPVTFRVRTVHFPHLPGVYISSLDGVEQQLSNPNSLYIDQVRLKQSFRCLKPFTTNFNNSAIRELQNRRCLKLVAKYRQNQASRNALLVIARKAFSSSLSIAHLCNGTSHTPFCCF